MALELKAPAAHRLTVEIDPGTKFDDWTVIEYAGSHRHGGAAWLCECYCGGRHVLKGIRLRAGKTPRCKKCAAQKRKAHQVSCVDCERNFEGHCNAKRCKPCTKIVDRINQLVARGMRALTVAEYKAMLQKCGGRCEVCDRQPTESNGDYLCIDHDHSTGEPRGILCSSCNTMIGCAGDSTSILRCAIEYLDGRKG